MAVLNPGLVDLSDDDRQVLESWLVEFDQDWDERLLANRLDQIPPGSSWRLPALAEMVKIDLQRQWGRGRQISLESYLAEFPELGSPGDVSADLIQAEYEVRRQFGAPLALVDYVRRFPHQAAELARMIPEGGSAQSRQSRVAGSPKTPETLPEQFGRYRIIKRLGQGGMGSVYLARDTHLERPVALKVPDFGNHEDPEARRRFLEEARTAATLDHPYLCPVYDAGEMDGQLYLTMGYIEGQSLAALIGEEGWPQRQVAALVGKLALALQEAHTRKVVHRDLKPANVMIKTTGQRREPVIVDFGLARRDNPQEQRLTRSGQVMGTLGYMAPEQIRGDLKEIGPACDIYALGVILYELLTGRLPFNGSGLAIAGQILTQTPLPPSTHRSDIDPALEAICLKAMAKMVGDRYTTMAELAAALTGWLQSSSAIHASAAPLDSPASLAPPSGERPRPAGSHSLVGQFLEQLAGDKAAPPPIPSPEPVASRAPLPGRRRPMWPMIVAAGALGVMVLFAIIYVITDKGRIKITVAGPALSIKVDRDEVRIEGLDEPITLRSGEHELTVIRGKTETETETRKFIVRRGNNEEVRLEYEPAASDQAKVDRQPAPSAEMASGRTDASPAAAPLGGLPVPPAALPVKPAEKLHLPRTDLVYVNEFNGPQTGLPGDVNIPHFPDHGESDGVFFVYSGGWWNVHRIPSDSSCEVVARVLSEDPRKTGSWSLSNAAQESRGFLIRINVKGELFLEPSPWPKAAAFRQIDPRVGPITHPAIKPGNEFNKLLLIMRKREVVILVNGIQVCEPIRFDFDIIPSVLALGAAGPGKKRAEFDRLEIREMMQPDDAHAKAEATTSASLAVKQAGPQKPQPTVPDHPLKQITNSIEMKLVLIPSGKFAMGSPEAAIFCRQLIFKVLHGIVQDSAGFGRSIRVGALRS